MCDWYRLKRLLMRFFERRPPDAPPSTRFEGCLDGPEVQMYRLLVIEGDSVSGDVEAYTALARDETLKCEHISWDAFKADSLPTRDVDLVVAILIPGDVCTANFLASVREHSGGRPLVVILPPDAEEAHIRLALQIADDFIVHPVRSLELRHRIARLLPVRRHDQAGVTSRLLDEMALAKLVGRDPVFLRAIEQVPRFARSEASVLITGETGTGKELCARAIHHLSRRRDAAFVAVDCGAVPDQLFENELFGHTRGAFTDAHRDHRGLVAMAHGGTLFLDEVDALSAAAQAKLLRFLQEHSFRPLGSDRFECADVKVIAATNRDLDAFVQAKQFRPDLYFRLNVLRIHLPPLRDRRSDIPVLAHSLLRDVTASVDGAPTQFSAGAIRVLTEYGWPGNVRELRNAVQRAVVVCDGDTILPSQIALGELAAASPPEGDFRSARAAAVAAFERRYIEELLRKHGGNVTHAAREAHQDRRVLGRFIKKYQINRRAL